ncbi:MAG TPA: hypothetical protein PLQ35_16685 [bacterium]|nr:hypothetical protein [bacterium]HQL63915.1 hypothetical protein [bacterium]
MKEFSRDEFSVFLDALLRTLLESRFGLNCWDRLAAPANCVLLVDAIDAAVQNEDVWQDIRNRVRLTDGEFVFVRDKTYLDIVKALFRERVAGRFRLPMVRVDPAVWTAESVEEWKGGNEILAVLTGNEILSIVQTVHALEEGRIGELRSHARVLGVPRSCWIRNDGTALGGVLVGEDGKSRLVRFKHPVRIHSALILNLPRKEEIPLHRQLTIEARETGIVLLNPAGRVSERADRKHLAHRCWERIGISTPGHWFVPKEWTRDQVHRLLLEIGERVLVVYVLPDDSTEGDRVRRFPLQSAEVENALLHITQNIQSWNDVLIREECGNVYIYHEGVPKRAVLRLNVVKTSSGTWSYSGCWYMARDASSDVVSVGCGAAILRLSGGKKALMCVEEEKHHFIPEEVLDMESIKSLAQIAVAALEHDVPDMDRLSLIAFDMIPVWHPDEVTIRWMLLEANARPAGLAAAELIP